MALSKGLALFLLLAAAAVVSGDEHVVKLTSKDFEDKASGLIGRQTGRLQAGGLQAITAAVLDPVLRMRGPGCVDA